MKYSLIIPLWNEEKNISILVQAIIVEKLFEKGMGELMLINNGSNDNSLKLINFYKKKFKWITCIHLKKNLNYGGGIYEGIKKAKFNVVSFIPGDLQILPSEVSKIFNLFKIKYIKNTNTLVKGRRTIRLDSPQTQFISKAYTLITKIILGLSVDDINGLPKMFDKKLIKLFPKEIPNTFVFDALILYIATKNKWEIIEFPVTFHARRNGLSSWSNKRLKIYLSTFIQIFLLRFKSD